MNGNASIADQVTKYLASLNIFSWINRKVLFKDIGVSSSAGGAALSYYSANTGVSMRGKDRGHPKFYYAIRMPLKYRADATENVYLSLPGIPRKLLERKTAEDKTIAIIKELQNHYGTETIDYWAKSAQRRSVDISRAGMQQALQRDQQCRLCIIADVLCQQREVPSIWVTPKRLTACHIVARKTIFWKALYDVHKQGLNIFSDVGTRELVKRLRTDKWHSDSKYIARLCREHDSQVQKTLKSAAI